jgi:hypothetical protein
MSIHLGFIRIMSLKSYTVLIISLLIMFLFWTGCSKNVTAPEESYNVQASMEIQTVDEQGEPVSVPVTFTSQKYRQNSGVSGNISTSKLVSDEQTGKVTFSIDYTLAESEYFTVIADVSEEKFVSTNYWTAYFQSSDAPVKNIEVSMTIVPKN